MVATMLGEGFSTPHAHDAAGGQAPPPKARRTSLTGACSAGGGGNPGTAAAPEANRGSGVFSPPDAARPKKQLDDTDLDVRRWVPDKFCQHYADAGVTQLYRWQVEALGTGSVLGGESLVYTAPTSGGKTMVAEILMLRSLLTKKRKAIMVLPYVSIVSEKCKVRHCPIFRSFGIDCTRLPLLAHPVRRLAVALAHLGAARPPRDRLPRDPRRGPREDRRGDLHGARLDSEPACARDLLRTRPLPRVACPGSPACPT